MGVHPLASTVARRQHRWRLLALLCAELSTAMLRDLTWQDASVVPIVRSVAVVRVIPVMTTYSDFAGRCDEFPLRSRYTAPMTSRLEWGAIDHEDAMRSFERGASCSSHLVPLSSATLAARSRGWRSLCALAILSRSRIAQNRRRTLRGCGRRTPAVLDEPEQHDVQLTSVLAADRTATCKRRAPGRIAAARRARRSRAADSMEDVLRRLGCAREIAPSRRRKRKKRRREGRRRQSR